MHGTEYMPYAGLTCGCPVVVKFHCAGGRSRGRRHQDSACRAYVTNGITQATRYDAVHQTNRGMVIYTLRIHQPSLGTNQPSARVPRSTVPYVNFSYAIQCQKYPACSNDLTAVISSIFVHLQVAGKCHRAAVDSHCASFCKQGVCTCNRGGRSAQGGCAEVCEPILPSKTRNITFSSSNKSTAWPSRGAKVRNSWKSPFFFSNAIRFYQCTRAKDRPS